MKNVPAKTVKFTREDGTRVTIKAKAHKTGPIPSHLAPYAKTTQQYARELAKDGKTFKVGKSHKDARYKQILKSKMTKSKK